MSDRFFLAWGWIGLGDFTDVVFSSAGETGARVFGIPSISHVFNAVGFGLASFAGFAVTLGPATTIVTSFNELTTDAVASWSFRGDINVHNGALVFAGIVGTLGNDAFVRAPELAAASSTLLFVNTVTWATRKTFGFQLIVPTVVFFTVFVVDKSLAGSENFARR